MRFSGMLEIPPVRGERPDRVVPMTARSLTLALLLAAVACRDQPSSGAPTLTYPGVDGHAAFLPLAGTPHDPTPPAPGSPAAVTCSDCHGGSSFRAFECITCHTHSDQAALTAFHQGAGVADFAFASSACYACHRNGLGVPADHSTRLFPIGTASHPAVCTSCHTDLLVRTPATLACAACHAARPTFPGKHAGVADFDPATATSADCVRCHADDTVPRLADHQARFPIAGGAAGAPHDTACLQCHPQLRADRAWAADFAAFSCTGCHQDPDTSAAHAGVGGYAYDSPSCYQCHPTGQAAPPDHTPSFFPIGAGTAHAGIGCTQCHTDLGSPTDPTRFACASCHLAIPGFPAHGPVSGVAILTIHTSRTGLGAPLALTSENCLRCHADAQVDRVADHPGGEDALGNQDHLGAGCITCHSSRRGDKPFGAAFDATPGCTTCH